MRPEIAAFFHRQTFTISYLVSDPATGSTAIIDPVRDFDPRSGRTGTAAADRLVAHVEGEGLNVEWILETHAHADHLTAAPYLKERLGGRIAAGSRIVEVQGTFKTLFNLGPEFAADGSDFDHLFADDEALPIGDLVGRVMHTPGHTPACVSYLVGDAVFVGDTIFMPDFGTARADFPGADAATLYRSIRRVLALPPETRLFMCHDYGPGGRELAWETTVGDERAQNIHVRDGISEEEFVAMRSVRDRTLEVPSLILPSLQVNIRAGRLPPPEGNGVSYLKLPVDAI